MMIDEQGLELSVRRSDGQVLFDQYRTKTLQTNSALGKEGLVIINSQCNANKS